MPTHAIRAVAVVAAFASAAVWAQPAEKSQDLERFSSFELNGCFDARLAPGTPRRITLRGSPEQLERVRVRQGGGRVIVEPADGWQTGFDLCRSKIEIEVTADFDRDAPVELWVRGSGNLDAQVPAAARLAAHVSGSGDLTLRGSAPNCEIEVAGSGGANARALDCSSATEVALHGSGSVVLEGKTRSCEFDVHGSGDVAAQDFSCDIAEVEISGSGSVELATVGELAVDINGSGDVRYRGQPTLRDIDINGSGRLRKL